MTPRRARKTVWRLALVLALGFGGPVLAEKKPVEVTGDRFTVDEAARTATFEGRVVLKQKGLDMTARKVTVTYGAGGPSDMVSMVATGNVCIVLPDQTGVGDRADYDPKTALMRLTGHVKVTNESGTVEAEYMLIDLNTNKTQFSAAGGGRVRAVFTPEN